MNVFTRKLFPVVFLAFVATNLHGQALPVPAPADPFNRLSPQSSMISFLEDCRSKNFERAARYLDLEKMSRDERRTKGPGFAQQLGEVLDRDVDFDVAISTPLLRAS